MAHCTLNIIYTLCVIHCVHLHTACCVWTWPDWICPFDRHFMRHGCLPAMPIARHREKHTMGCPHPQNHAPKSQSQQWSMTQRSLGLWDVVKKLLILYTPWPLWTASGSCIVGTKGLPAVGKIAESDNAGREILSYVPLSLVVDFLSEDKTCNFLCIYKQPGQPSRSPMQWTTTRSFHINRLCSHGPWSSALISIQNGSLPKLTGDPSCCSHCRWGRRTKRQTPPPLQVYILKALWEKVMWYELVTKKWNTSDMGKLHHIKCLTRKENFYKRR